LVKTRRPGSIERGGGDAVYNTALVFSPDGHLVARYRKLFPWRPFEASTPGDAPPTVFEIAGVGRFGAMTCYDGWFPEVARSITVAGREAILHPTLTTTPDRQQELVLDRANAIANQLYVVNVKPCRASVAAPRSAWDPKGRSSSSSGRTRSSRS